MDKATYHKCRNIRQRARLTLDEINRGWLDWTTTEQDRLDVLQVAESLERLYTRAVVACARYETDGRAGSLAVAATEGDSEQER